MRDVLYIRKPLEEDDDDEEIKGTGEREIVEERTAAQPFTKK